VILLDGSPQQEWGSGFQQCAGEVRDGLGLLLPLFSGQRKPNNPPPAFIQRVLLQDPRLLVRRLCSQMQPGKPLAE
jgi:hypothetical protein